MSDMKVCPYCKTFTARPVVYMENGVWKYVCSRCHAIFVP